MNTRNGTPFTQSELVLRTNYILSSNTVGAYPVSNSIGSISQGRVEYTWNTINLMDILGDLYNKFEYFNLILRAVQQGNFVGGPSSLNDRVINLVASGPNWINSSYDVGKRCITSEAVIGQLIMNSAQGYITMDDNCITTFRKTPTFNFTIKLQTIAGVPPVFNPATVLYPSATFFFDIIPVQFPEPEKYAQVY